ncbi:MAG: alkaline phosphatase family protein [Pseudomonadota bacterium]|nr:alkaline phosphatase family protein [Pseudomonadota bacterium]
MADSNVLFVTLDQMPAHILRGPLSQHVPTPGFDRLMAEGVSFDRHYTVTVPCGPARASLLTGLYAMNHRSIRNGTPLARHHATVATEARKAGYEPLLFGYTDTSPDPTGRAPEDPDLTIYEGVAPGFRELVEMRLEAGLEWPAYLKNRGYVFDLASFGHLVPVPPEGRTGRPSDPALYSARDSDTAYLTDRTLTALDIRKDRPWFAHLAYIRPHPPLVAPAPYNSLVDPAALPSPNLARPDHPFVDAWFSEPAETHLYLGHDGDGRSMTPELVAELRAIYLGLVAEVDHHLGRVLDWLDATGQAERTLVIVTVDHGEMLGDKHMWGKHSVFEPAWHVPLIVRDPRHRGAAGRRVEAITETVDIAPTILDWIGLEPPPQMDGLPLAPWLKGETPAWRDAAFLEIDLSNPVKPTRFQKHFGLDANQCNAAIMREKRWKLVYFNGGVAPMLFDLENDPGETVNLASDPSHAGELTRLMARMLDRRMTRADRRLTGYAIGG